MRVASSTTAVSTEYRPLVPAQGQVSKRCLDCPATRSNVFAHLVGEGGVCCGFESVTVEPRESVPLRWFDRFSFGFVRRGALIRQRTDAQGRATAVDVVGPGGAFPLEPRHPDSAEPSTAAGYAVTRTLICACKEGSLTEALGRGGQDALDMYRLHREALYRMERIADARSRALVASRVAALLCALADTVVQGVGAHARIPQGFLLRDLASLLAIRHESVCRVLGEFTRKGYVRQTDEGLLLLDRKVLEAI